MLTRVSHSFLVRSLSDLGKEIRSGAVWASAACASAVRVRGWKFLYVSTWAGADTRAVAGQCSISSFFSLTRVFGSQR